MTIASGQEQQDKASGGRADPKRERASRVRCALWVTKSDAGALQALALLRRGVVTVLQNLRTGKDTDTLKTIHALHVALLSAAEAEGDGATHELGEVTYEDHGSERWGTECQPTETGTNADVRLSMTKTRCWECPKKDDTIQYLKVRKHVRVQHSSPIGDAGNAARHDERT